MQSFVVAPHEERDVTLPSGDTFRVVLFGGSDEAYIQRDAVPPPVFFCVHGAGMCSSSFFTLATHLLHSQNDDNMSGVVRLAVYDMRCHGQSTFRGGESSLTLEVLIDDFCSVVRAVKDTFFAHTSRLYIAGHSLGGAIVASGLRNVKELHSIVAGVVLFDVVEGTAKLSLEHMDKFLKNRPREFVSVDAATQWFLQHGGMCSPTAAAVTVPPLLSREGERFVWRTNLHAMKDVWSKWFDGLDDAFIALPFPKILCLANTERLDATLTVAQMQGKFQFEVVGNGSGHYLMDDRPDIVSAKVRHFVYRIERMSEKLSQCMLKKNEP